MTILPDKHKIETPVTYRFISPSRVSKESKSIEKQECNTRKQSNEIGNCRFRLETAVFIASSQVIKPCVVLKSEGLGLGLCFALILSWSSRQSAQWGGPSGIEAQSLGPLFLQCFDTVGWVF